MEQTSSQFGMWDACRWMKLAGYEHLWESVGVKAHTPPPTPTLEQMLDRRSRHTDHCAVCQKVSASMQEHDQPFLLMNIVGSVCSCHSRVVKQPQLVCLCSLVGEGISKAVLFKCCGAHVICRSACHHSFTASQRLV